MDSISISISNAIVTVAVLARLAGTADAENCVDKEVALASGGRPCMELGTSFGRVESWTAPGFQDVRVGVLRMGLYGNDHARRGTSVELATWETVGDPDDGLEGPRDLGDASVLHAFTLRRQIDRDGWGLYVAGDLITRWFGVTRVATPKLGIRVGRFDRAAAIVEARFAGAFLIGTGDGDRALTADLDVGARTTYVVSRRLRLEGRGRYRDLRATDGRQLRDVFVAAGVELEASPPGPTPGPNTWRVLTLFAGVGVRRALVDIPADPETAGLAARPPSSPPGGPWQLLVWVDLDFAMNSSLAIW